MRRTLAALAALITTASAGTPAAKQPATVTPAAPEASWGDAIWKHAVLWEDQDAYWFQKIRIIARYHTNYAWTQDDVSGREATDWETRRLRFGYNVEFLKQFEFRNEWNSIGWDDDEFDPEISNVDTLFLSWKPSMAFNITVGKHKSPVTQEFRWSSNEMETIERTIATKSFMPIERHWGVSVWGEIGRWAYHTGLWAGSFEGDYNISFDADGPTFFFSALGYDFGGQDQAWQKAFLQLQYVHSSEPTNIAPKFDNIISLNFEEKKGPWGFNTDHLIGFGDRNAYGMYLQPSYFFTDKWQIVTRYSYGSGDTDSFQQRNRYEGLVTAGAGASGDQYQSFYTGLNYYLYGHKLKLMAGAEYTNMKDSSRKGGAFDGWTALTGLVFWF
jgi:phosphate-selective porin OprO and OprP